MSKGKRTVIICDICDGEQIKHDDSANVDLEVLGLTLNGFYAGPGGGGPLEKDLFICEDCLRENEQGEALPLHLLASIACMGVRDWQERVRDA